MPDIKPFEQFFNAVQELVQFTDEEKEKIKSAFVFREVPRKYQIVKHGEICREMYFLIKGCARLYYQKESGEEVTGFFFTENLFFSSQGDLAYCRLSCLIQHLY